MSRATLGAVAVVAVGFALMVALAAWWNAADVWYAVAVFLAT